MPYQVGLNCKLYYDASGVGGSSWSEITDAEDVNCPQGHKEAQINPRGSDDELTLLGQKVRSINFKIDYDQDDAAYEALRDAFINKSVIGIAAMDEAIATVGAEGVQADMVVTQFDREEPVNGAVTINVTLKPAANATTAPALVEVSS